MRIDSEIKLDYKDVLIRPKRSTLRSRKHVSLERTYRFRNSHNEWTGIPIMASNMDGVGTLKMHYVLSHHNLFTCAIKHYNEKDWDESWIDPEMIALSVGTNMEDYTKAKSIIKTNKLKWICIDIANGYSEHFVDFVRMVRKDFPKANIIA